MAMDEERMKMIMAAQHERGPTISPSVPYAKWLVEDTGIPTNFPDGFRNTIYDKELGTSNITRKEKSLIKLGFLRAEIMLDNGRPVMSSKYEDEIILVTLPSKLDIKLSKSIDGFQQKQLSTQTTISHVHAPGAAGVAQKKSKWRIFGRKPAEVKRE